MEWFAAQVRAARSQDRLAELAELLPQSGIRRRHWWNGQPAALDAPDYSHGDEDRDDDNDPGEDGYPLATAAAAVDYASALAARSWVWRPHGTGLCQLVHLRPHGWSHVPPQACLGRAAAVIGGGAVCEMCLAALRTPMAG